MVFEKFVEKPNFLGVGSFRKISKTSIHVENVARHASGWRFSNAYVFWMRLTLHSGGLVGDPTTGTIGGFITL